MAAATLLLGILLLVRLVSVPPNKPPFGRLVKISAALVGALYSTYIAFLSVKVPKAVPYVIGQTFGAVFILLIFVAIGTVIRKKISMYS